MLIKLLHYFSAGLIAAAALLIVVTPSVLYAALSFLIILISLAFIYFLQGVAFIAVIHIIIYVGGILLFNLFSLILLKLNIGQAFKRTKLGYTLFIVILLILCLTPLLYLSIKSLPQPTLPQAPPGDTIVALGLQLLGPYALALELAGIILLIALLGAVYIARGK